jgi:D-alanyl-lipoteichoic acid acyltransferase DltB (MBOAT superfamily)
VEPRRDFLDYATFVTMFPQLVAGPIERARNLLPQVESERVFDHARFRSGLSLALWGAVKKVVIADTVALYVDKIFVMPNPTAPLIAAATLGFSVQILADFSGYTDLARGTARMLGFELMENFRAPYLAANPSEFWKRWHISLSSWIHEYVYAPFRGASRGMRRRLLATYGALLLSGLWHGASWNFVLWGAYHASLLTGYRLAARVVPSGLSARAGLRPFKVLLMFGFTLLGWLLFRESDFARLQLYATLPWVLGDIRYQAALGAVLTVSLAGGGLLMVALFIDRVILTRLRPLPIWPLCEALFWPAAVASIFLFARQTANAFIYFQF